ncbi:unnamed protein product [Ostreobium quekettii]|uniref:Elongator complex protein 1 n=1 Tax=Ostreobium quekettii TaxID=121088 RepID=A0A8S1J514_9CHLO|nr:unnamed protein product [Ostreobium quekettii]
MISFLLELESLFLCLSSGELLLIDCKGEDVEDVGIVEGSLAAAAWSPDGEILALVSGQGNLLLMNMEWEVLSEVCLHQAMSLSVVGEENGSTVVSNVAVSWRGDGQYFAVLGELNAMRTLSIWERESCSLHSTGDTTNLVGRALAWQPNGRHIYATCNCDGHLSMKLFEKNGLGHGSFDLPSQGCVGQAIWSLDSQLLALVVEPSERGSMPWKVQVWRRSNWHWYLKHERCFATGCQGLQLLWDEEAGTQQLHILTGRGGYCCLSFVLDADVSHMGTAAVVDGHKVLMTPFRHMVMPPPLSAAKVQFLDPIQCLAFRNGAPREALAVVMSTGKMGFVECPVEDQWDHPDLLQDPSEDNSEECNMATVSGMVIHEVELADVIGAARHMVWLHENRVLVVGAPPLGSANSGDVCVEVEICDRKGDVGYRGAVSVRASPQLGHQICRMVDVPGASVLQLDNGSLIKYAAEHQQSPFPTVAGFPVLCPHMCCLVVPQASGLPQAHVVGLTDKGQLYFDATAISGHVTSMLVRRSGAGGVFLAFVTGSNELHIVPYAELQGSGTEGFKTTQSSASRRVSGYKAVRRSGPTQDMHAAMRPPATVTNQTDLHIRQVEQGSRLVASPPGTSKVILQMTRGNLETVCPRVLVLCAICDALQQKGYAEAWRLATSNRVDLNVLVDYRWPAFVVEADIFVAEVDNEEDICDMMMALKPGSTLQEGGLYADFLSPTVQTPVVPEERLIGGKIPAICRAIRTAVQNAGKGTYLKAVVMSHARNAPPDLKNALQCIRDAREAEVTSEKPDVVVNGGQDGLPAGRSGEALAGLMLHVDAEKLYREALGMYDLELAYMVVTHAQRDPGEYLLELQAFSAMHPLAYQKHQIDLHLKRYELALHNLVAAGDAFFEKAVDLAKEQGLMRDLLGLVDADSNKRKVVLMAYGEWLEGRGMLEDAGTAYLATGREDMAIESYRAAGQWRTALMLANRQGWSKRAVTDMAHKLYEDLRASGRLSEAASVALDYLQDTDDAVVLLAEARQWQEAVHIAYRQGRGDLVETTVAPAAAECATTLLSDFREAEQRVSRYFERLKDVRAKRIAMEAVVGETGDTLAGALEDRDGAGEDASTVAGMSMYTDRTAAGTTVASTASVSALTVGGRKPQRRKGKNKGLKIRQGSPEEEATLCAHLINLCPTRQMCEEVGQLTELLILLGHERDARVLQQSLGALVSAQQRAADDIAQNPPPAGIPGARASSKACVNNTGVGDVRWKWDILRAVRCDTPLGA